MFKNISIKRKDVPLLLLICYFLKCVIIHPSIIDSSILLILSLATIYFEYKINDHKIQELNDQITKIDQNLQIKLQEFESIKSYINSQKLRVSQNGR